ncbi:hypothetical protein Trydic_g22735 [Trypoxylus dichotomus]
MCNETYTREWSYTFLHICVNEALNRKLLPLVLTNLNVEFAVAHDLGPFVGEDPHLPALDILISLDLPSDPLDCPSNTNLRYNFRKVDVPALCSELGAVDWDTKSTMSGIASACDASMPRKVPRHCKRAAYWWTAEIAELRRRCLRLRRIAQRAGNREEANIRSAEHREAKKSLRRAINESKARHWKDMVSDVDSDPWGLGYKLVTRRLGAMKPQAILELTRMQRIVRALFPSHPARVDRGVKMPGDFLPFNEEELRTVMGSLAQRRAPGPDNITNEILKLVYQHSPHLLLDMYNERLAAGVFPTCWKVARLVLITKKQGDPDDPSTYRPLCMLDTAGKVLERLIRTRLQAVMEDAGGLSPRQYGFRRGRSTADALREVCEAVTRAEDHNHYSRRIVLLVTLDVRNALNSARWVDILNALEHSFRLPLYLLRMIDDYLGNRSIIYDTKQGRCNDKVTSAVAQGSILGPDFWNILYDGFLRQEMPEEVTLVGCTPKYNIIGNFAMSMDTVGIKSSLDVCRSSYYTKRIPKEGQVHQQEFNMLLPVQLAINDTLRYIVDLFPPDITQLRKHCLRTSYIVWDSSFCEQRDGIAMRSPLSLVLANLFMEHFESLAIETEVDKPTIWWRNVDDTFVV